MCTTDRKRKARLRRRFAMGALAVLAAASFSSCSHLAYQPSPLMYVADPKVLDGVREEVTFPSTDGTPLAGWYFKARKGGHKGVVVQFHGNAQNMTAHFASLVWLIDEGYDFFTFDYRGYGISEGKPSQEGLNRDALAAIAYALKRTSGPVVLYGQSLGGAVLLRAFDDLKPENRRRVRAVVAEGTFHDYHEIARNMLARSWVTFMFQPLAYVLMSDAYSPEAAIPRISPTPLLVIHGDSDPVIPLKFGRKIYDLAREPKRLLVVPGGTHIDSMMIRKGIYRTELLDYLAKLP